jgi:hypothetical protein
MKADQNDLPSSAGERRMVDEIPKGGGAPIPACGRKLALVKDAHNVAMKENPATASTAVEAIRRRMKGKESGCAASVGIDKTVDGDRSDSADLDRATPTPS